MEDKYAEDKHEELITELSKLATPIKQILKYIKKHPGEIVIKDETRLKLTGEVDTKVMNLEEFSQPIADLLEQFEVAIEKQDKKLAEALANNKPTITIQQDYKELEKVHKALFAISENFQKLAEREVKIVVKAPDVHIKAPQPKVEEVTIKNRGPSQAIPVVLTNKDLKKFYDAITGGGGGFGSVGLSIPVINSATENDPDGNPVAVVPVVGPDGNPIGGGSQYAEDTPHASGDLGTMALGVRKDIATALAGADGDYQPPISDAAGRQHNRAVPDRPAQGTGRVYKTGIADQISASGLVYTVTAGKKLYITSWGQSMQNISTISAGHVRLRDGGASGAIVASWGLPTALAGAVAPQSRGAVGFPEPKQFSTSVYLEIVTGTIMTSFQFTGYEE